MKSLQISNYTLFLSIYFLNLSRCLQLSFKGGEYTSVDNEFKKYSPLSSDSKCQSFDHATFEEKNPGFQQFVQNVNSGNFDSINLSFVLEQSIDDFRVSAVNIFTYFDCRIRKGMFAFFAFKEVQTFLQLYNVIWNHINNKKLKHLLKEFKKTKFYDILNFQEITGTGFIDPMSSILTIRESSSGAPPREEILDFIGYLHTRELFDINLGLDMSIIEALKVNLYDNSTFYFLKFWKKSFSPPSDIKISKFIKEANVTVIPTMCQFLNQFVTKDENVRKSFKVIEDEMNCLNDNSSSLDRFDHSFILDSVDEVDAAYYFVFGHLLVLQKLIGSFSKTLAKNDLAKKSYCKDFNCQAIDDLRMYLGTDFVFKYLHKSINFDNSPQKFRTISEKLIVLKDK